MKRGRARFAVTLSSLALTVLILDAWGSMHWRSIAASLALNAEAGAQRLGASAVVAFPPVVERSRRMVPRDLAMASRESVVDALSRVGTLQSQWLPTNAIGFTNLARAALLNDQTDRATRIIQDAVVRDPTSPYLHRVRALVSLYIGDLDSALADLAVAEALAPGMRSPAVEIAPENTRFVRLEGLRLRRRYYPRKATETALALAREIRRDGDRDAAVVELVEFEGHPAVEIELATWEIEEGSYSSALKRLGPITEKRAYPSRVRAKAWTTVAVARDYEGDREGALEAANTALRLDPSSTGPYITLAGLAQRRGDYEGALGHLRRAWGMNPSDDNLLVRIAGVAERAGKTGDALLALGRAVEINPGAPDLWGRLVALQIRSGRFSEAAITLSRALDRFPTDPGLLRQAEQLRRDVGVR
jgi:tetratricopeptide (TPR) repeat protein